MTRKKKKKELRHCETYENFYEQLETEMTAKRQNCKIGVYIGLAERKRKDKIEIGGKR